MIRGYFLLFTQESLPWVLVGPSGVMGIKPGSFVYKASILPLYYLSRSSAPLGLKNRNGYLSGV